MKTVLFVENVYGPKLPAQWAYRVGAWFNRKPYDVLIGPAYLDSKKWAHKFISWDELRNWATCHQLELEEFLAFNQQCIALLEREKSNTVNGISIADALKYAFLAPHSEFLPFYISALHRLLKTEGITHFSCLSKHGRLTRLAQAVAISAGRTEVRPFKGLRSTWAPYNFLQKALLFIKKLRIQLASWEAWSFLLHSRVPNLIEIPSHSIALCLTKPRSNIYIQPIQKALGGQHPNFILSTESSSNRYRPTSNAYSFIKSRPGIEIVKWRQHYAKQLRQAWQNQEKALKQIPTTFMGVKIGPHHLEEVWGIFQTRGVDAALTAHWGKKFLERHTLSALMILDPLENNRVMARLAQIKNIPVCTYFSVYTGQSSASRLHEESYVDITTHFFVVNSWIQNRLVKIYQVPSQRIQVVGEILADRTALTLDKPGLEKSVLFLSRYISNAMPAATKRSISLALKQVHENVGIKICVRAHPHEDLNELRRELDEWGCRAFEIAPSNALLLDLIRESSVVVSVPGSSAPLEAFYAQVPVVLYGNDEEFKQLDEMDFILSYRRYQAAACTTSSSELASAIQKILNSSEERTRWIQNGRQFGETIVGSLDGKAGERLAQGVFAAIVR